jgi:hypothetical protein
MIDKKLESMEYLNCLGKTVVNAARCTHEIKSAIVMAKAAYKRRLLSTANRTSI